MYKWLNILHILIYIKTVSNLTSNEIIISNFVFHNQIMAIKKQKKSRSQKSKAIISVCERMITTETTCIHSCQS